MIIDPHVGPYSEPEEIRAWIATLDARRQRALPGDRDAFSQALDEARGWLEHAEGLRGGR